MGMGIWPIFRRYSQLLFILHLNVFIGLTGGETLPGPVREWQRYRRRDSRKSFRVMSLEVSQNYSLETQIIFELGKYTTTWKAGKRFWAKIRVLNNFGSCVGFGIKYRLRTFFVPLGVICKGKRMIRLSRHPLNLKIILHVGLSLSLYARHCLIESTLVRYPCWGALVRFIHPTSCYHWLLNQRSLGCVTMPVSLIFGWLMLLSS